MPKSPACWFGAIQPSILRLGGDRLLALGRTRQGKIFQIASDDLGRTWGKMSATRLPNPNSGIDAATLADGRHLVVYNHTAKGRFPLNVALSADGQSWQAALVLLCVPTTLAGAMIALLVTGDSMSQPLDAELARRIARSADGVKTVRDPRIGTALSQSEIVDWGKLSAVQVKRDKPNAVVVFIGANEGFPMRSGGRRSRPSMRAAMRPAARFSTTESTTAIATGTATAPASPYRWRSRWCSRWC